MKGSNGKFCALLNLKGPAEKKYQSEKFFRLNGQHRNVAKKRILMKT